MTALTRPIEAAFRSAKVPYQIIGGVSFYERQEVKDILSYLSLMTNPKDDLAFARIVNVPPRGLGKTSLDHVVEVLPRQREHPTPGDGAAGQSGRWTEGQGGPRLAGVHPAGR